LPKHFNATVKGEMKPNWSRSSMTSGTDLPSEKHLYTTVRDYRRHGYLKMLLAIASLEAQLGFYSMAVVLAGAEAINGFGMVLDGT
jgi:hypothetical protein